MSDSYIKKCYSQGVPITAIAEALGVTASAITQRVAALQLTAPQDAKLDSLEAKILSKLESTLDLVIDPMKLAKLLQVVNGAKRRGEAIGAGVPGFVSTADLPPRVVNNFIVQFNAQNQAVAVGGKTLVTIGTDHLRRLQDEQGRTSSTESTGITELLEIGEIQK